MVNACHQELADGVFASHLSEYLGYEMRWLEGKAASVSASTKGVSSSVVQRLLNWNAEAVDRATTLATDTSKTANVRMLFHASTAAKATTGCLLEQVRNNRAGCR